MAFHAASSSSSSSSPSSSPYSYSSIHPWIYDVFLSFKGEDTLYTFTAYLYDALRREEIKIYMDNALSRREEISEENEKAIEVSKISIIVFSQNYASSRWCLEELKKILECKETRYQKVFPVFYEVDPSEVRNQTKRVGQAFTELEDKLKDEMKLQSWKAALTAVGNLSGWHMPNGYESHHIPLIVQKMVRLLRCTQLSIVKHLIGIESCVKQILSHLDIEKSDVRMVGIFGLGGIGKTTIAKAIYEVIGHHFMDKCFLGNVREISEQKGGLVQLQKTFLLEILGGDKSFMFHNADRGIIEIKEMLHSKRVFVILDDVNQLDQLEILVGKCDWFGSGSRVIITTRDKKILTNHEVHFQYEVEKLKDNEALQLFSLIALEGVKPYEKFPELAREAICYAEGLPLALRETSLVLSCVSEYIQKSTLDGYKEIPHQGVQEILRSSFDGLEENEKNIFLDVACFFKGEDIEYVTDILDNCGYFPDRGIERLKDKSLITIGKSNTFEMHALVQEMGKTIAQEESTVELDKCRLWLYKDILPVLQKDMGTNKVKGLLVDLPGECGMYLNPMAFKTMRMLKLFINRSVRFSETPSFLPNELRLLEWFQYPGESMPSNFHGKNLVVVKMPESKLQSLESFENCRHLTVMKFPNCKLLTKIPDVSRTPNLKLLDFHGCANLSEVDGSVGSLDKLVVLDLSGCSELTIFPRSLKLRSLVSISLEHCKRLRHFPEFECQMKHLATVRFGSTRIKELPSSFDNVIGLKRLCLDFCKELNFLKIVGDDDDRQSESFSVSREKSIRLFGEALLPLQPKPNPIVCHNDYSLVPFPYLSTLERLDLSGTSMVSLPAGIQTLQRLHQLKLNNCRKLEEISVLPPSLKKLYAQGCISLKRFQFDSEDSPMFHRIDLIGCCNLHWDIGKDVWDLLSSKRHPEFHEFNISFPGNKIPSWFRYRQVSRGKSYKITCSGLEHLEGRIRGIVFCAVFAFGAERVKGDAISRCTVDLISGGSKIYSFENVLPSLDLSSTVLHYFVSESFKLKGGGFEVHFRCVSGPALFLGCGVNLVSRHNEEAADRTNIFGNECLSSRTDELDEECGSYEDYFSFFKHVADEDGERGVDDWLSHSSITSDHSAVS